jgi:chorismate dehydratase
MLRGEEQEAVNLSFSIPSVCAAEIAEGATEIGLVPVAEIARQGLEIMADVGIVAHGAVRSILLISRVPWAKIRSLAADLSSRTSVQLAKVILRERFGVEPEITEEKPDWREMLSHSDAALVIGDPALRIQPEKLPYEHLDLGAEWNRLTGVPMVFAAWAGKPGTPGTGFRDVARRSYQFGMAHLPEILSLECAKRGISVSLGERYFSEHIHFPLGPPELEGLRQFWALSGTSAPLTVSHSK